ncbi:low temperature requirement protein A [Pendulispora albinea]|uniref:Low temperature requirement protein A n=1 Tax=Pendulispora albinea TaxID=2741071 RepID=A0ABZ2M0D9_9BACT
MSARDPHEEGRIASALELLFDLCFVVAVAQAAAQLHHALSGDAAHHVAPHIGHGLLGYALVFYAIFWAWLNFTWFASAFDTDDGMFRFTTLVQIGGVLVLAAGVPAAFEALDFTVPVMGYVIMRLAMVSQWLRVAKSCPELRPTAMRYAIGIVLVQIGWLLWLWIPHGPMALAAFAVLALGEGAVPVVAENAGQTPWHRHHITERYGLFNIIVLGEVITASTAAIGDAAGGHSGHVLPMIGLAAAGLVIVFSMWSLYFDHPAHHVLTSFGRAIAFGFGHIVIFAAAAMVGAGIEVAIDFDTGKTSLGPVAAALALTVPVAIYLLAVWLLIIRHLRTGPASYAFPVSALAVLAVSFSPAPIHISAAILATLVFFTGRTKS